VKVNRSGKEDGGIADIVASNVPKNGATVPVRDHIDPKATDYSATVNGINAVRVFLPRCWFDEKKCARGIDALKLYRADYDDKLQALRPQPVHDWASHGADACRYLAMTLDRKVVLSGFHKRIEYSQHGVV